MPFLLFLSFGRGSRVERHVGETKILCERRDSSLVPPSHTHSLDHQVNSFTQFFLSLTIKHLSSNFAAILTSLSTTTHHGAPPPLLRRGQSLRRPPPPSPRHQRLLLHPFLLPRLLPPPAVARQDPLLLPSPNPNTSLLPSLNP